jgi:hypothetical protein
MASGISSQSSEDLAESQSSTDDFSSEQSQYPAALRTFSLFPKLPIELRLLVWEMALPEPRCLEMVQILEETGLLAPHLYSKYWKVTPSSSRQDKSPAMLFASHEPREVALKHYQPFKHGYPSIQNERTSYIDPHGDILLCEPWYMTAFNIHGIAEAIPNLARLAIDVHDISDACHSVGELRRFGQLKELITVPMAQSVRSVRPHRHCVF